MDKAKQLKEEKILKLLLVYSLPAMVGMVINSIYNIVDRIFIGNSPDLSALGLAGITIAFPIVIIMMAVAMLFGVGGSILFSMRLGQGKPEQSAIALGNTTTLLIISGISIMVICLIFLRPLLIFFGASEEVLPYAIEYMRVILFGALFQNLSMGLNWFARADGHPKTAMFTMLIGSIINIILNPLFIYVFKWGMAGSALATIIGQTCSAIWVLSHFLGQKCTIKLSLHNMLLKAEYVKKIIPLGISSFSLQLASCILTIVLNVTVAAYGGDIAVSVFGILNTLSLFIILPVIGVNQGMQPIIAFNYGAGSYARVKKTFYAAILLATVIVIFGFIMTRLLPRQMISIFNDDPQLIALGVRGIQIWFLSLPIVGLQIIGANYFQSVGKVKTAILLSTSRQILFLIPFVLILSRFFGMDGVLYAIPISDALSCLITSIFAFVEMRRYRKLVDVV